MKDLIPIEPRYKCRFSADRVYRYTLQDVWNTTLPSAVFIGLNPSTADEFKLDPTLTRIRKWSEQWGYGSFTMLNLFAFRSPHPKVMQAHPDPVGPLNNLIIRNATCEGSPTVIACWGAGGEFKDRANRVLEILPPVVHCLGLTADGHPIHPMARGKHRLPDALQLQPFRTIYT